MNTKYLYIIIAFLLVAVGFLSFRTNSPLNQDRFPTQNFNNQGMGQGNGLGPGMVNKGPINSRENCLADECLAVDNLNYPTGELSETAKVALTKALDDEYKALATYEAVTSKLGNVRPFIMITRAEEQHISSLKALFDKYALDIPTNPYTGKITSPESLAESCSLGVDAEIANASLYKDELLPSVENYQDITLVFNNLMNASQQKHLPAFQRCAQ